MTADQIMPITSGFDIEPNMNMNGKETALLQTLQGNYRDAKVYSSAWISKIVAWKQEYNGDKYGNEVKGKSQIVARDIKKYSEWLNPSIIDPFVSTPDIVKCDPTHPSSVNAAKANELVLNTQFCRQFNRFNFLSRAIKVLDTEGTCVIKTGWEYQEDKRTIKYNRPTPILDNNGEMILDQNGQPLLENELVEEERVIALINRPTAMVCRNEDIFLDPTCLGDMDKCQFIIHRFETNLSTLSQDPRYKNLDKVQLSMDEDFKREALGFRFEDKARKNIVVYEYWGNYDYNEDGIAEPIVCSWVGNILIRLEDNPYPDKKPPFIICPFLPEPFSLYGESNAEMLSEIQKVKTAILRGFIDNMAASNNGQIGIRKGTLDVTNKNRMLRGENFEYQGDPNSIFVGQFNQLPNSIFNFLQYLTSEAESLTGVNSFGTNPVYTQMGENSTSKGVLDGGNQRKLHIVRNISENLVKPLLRKWMEYNAEYLDEETMFRITETDFIPVRRDDLYGSIDIDLRISTNEDNQLKAGELSFLLQTIGPHEDPKIRQRIMSQIAKLYKMPDLAYFIDTYQPQPDPMQQAMLQAQLENLQAQTHELMTSSERNIVDGSLKEAKIPVEQAKARQLGANTDFRNLEYYQKQQGIDKMQDFAKTQADLESKERMKQMDNETKLAIKQMELVNKEKDRATQYSPTTKAPSNRNPYVPSKSKF
ncbi:hypothetical protein NON42_001166 [Campylobacter coli]|nr:hypothetical protein [Campylobacter coli]